MSYRTDKLVIDGHTDTHIHIHTQATTIPEGQNWPRVKMNNNIYVGAPTYHLGTSTYVGAPRQFCPVQWYYVEAPKCYGWATRYQVGARNN